MKNIKENILVQSIPLFLVLIIFLFTQNEIYITLGIICLIGLSFAIKYQKKEWKIVIFGIFLGFLFELAGNFIYQAQYWKNASLWGIPIWLPLMWGYGFIFIRRIGNALIKK